MSDVLVRLVDNVRVIPLDTKPHDGVILSLRSFSTLCKVRVPWGPRVLAEDRPYGPDAPSAVWAAFGALGERGTGHILDRIARGPPQAARAFLDSLVSEWYAACREQLCDTFQLTGESRAPYLTPHASGQVEWTDSRLVFPSWARSANFPRAYAEARASRSMVFVYS